MKVIFGTISLLWKLFKKLLKFLGWDYLAVSIFSVVSYRLLLEGGCPTDTQGTIYATFLIVPTACFVGQLFDFIKKATKKIPDPNIWYK